MGGSGAGRDETHAGRQRMTAQEGVCRLAPATGSLQGRKTHDAALTAGHVHTVRAGCNEGAGRICGVPVVSQHLR